MSDASKITIYGDVKAQALVAASPLVFDKRLAALTAEFALRCHILQALSLDGQTQFVVSRWGQFRTFSHVNDVEVFLRQLGGKLVTIEDVAAFSAAIASAGMEPPADIVADGRIHRFSTDGEGGPCDGWYVLRYEACLTGEFGKRRGSTFEWSPTAGVERASGDKFEEALSSLRAQSDSFSLGISAASERQDSVLMRHLAAEAIRVADRMLELDVQPGLPDSFMAEDVDGAH